MPYDEALFHAKYPEINPPHWYWMVSPCPLPILHTCILMHAQYNDGLMKVCEKHTKCGVQRLPIGLFDADVLSWNRQGQKDIHVFATEADGHTLAPGQSLPIAFREMFVWQ